MRLWIASDHAGFNLKQELLKDKSIEWIDLGPQGVDSVDYPLYADKLCQKVLAETSDKERLGPCGVLICGSGVGVSISANRFKGIRAVLALREDVAVLSRQHNASNVLCFGERLIPAPEAKKILQAWLRTDFEGGRHERRVNQIDTLGSEPGN